MPRPWPSIALLVIATLPILLYLLVVRGALLPEKHRSACLSNSACANPSAGCAFWEPLFADAGFCRKKCDEGEACASLGPVMPVACSSAFVGAAIAMLFVSGKPAQ